MPVISIYDFKGELPARSEKLLATNFAQDTENCVVEDGRLRALAALSDETYNPSGSSLRTIHKIGGYWVHFDAVCNMVRGLVSEASDHLFFTGDGYPKRIESSDLSGNGEPSASEMRRLGVQAPTDTLTITEHGTAGDEVAESYVYTYTLVDDKGQESPPITPQPTSPVDLYEGKYISLSGFGYPEFGESGNTITHYRFYRLVATESGDSAYTLIKMHVDSPTGTAYYDVPVDQVTTSVYDVNGDQDGLSDDYGESLATLNWDNPDTSLEGLTAYHNGMLAAFSGKTVYFSEPAFPYAWPSTYTRNLDYDIVTLVRNGDFLVALTEGYPSVFNGVDPDSIIKSPLGYAQACVAARGAVETPLGVLYPSPDGLFLINGVEGRLVTRGVWTRSQWRDYDLANMFSFWHNDRYLAFFSGSGDGFIFDPVEQTISSFSLSGDVYGGYVDPETDTLYLIYDDSDDYVITAWDSAASYLTASWTSKTFQFPRPVSFSCIRVVASGNVTVEVWADGVKKVDTTYSDSKVHRLPSGFVAREWKVVLSTTGYVDEVSLGTSVEELISNG